MSEKEYKELGDELAKLAVSSGLGGDQLRQLYRDVRTKSLPEVEARVQRQIGRSLTGAKGGPRGYDVFGPRFLDLLKEYEDKRHGLERILRYANMVYPYHMAEAPGTPTGQPRTSRTSSLRPPAAAGQVEQGLERKLEDVVKDVCSKYGYGGIRLSQERGGYLVNVTLRRFQGNLRELSDYLYEEAVSHFPELSNRVRFWIDRR